MFLSISWVDPILQNHSVLLAIMSGGEYFGIRDGLFDVRSGINPSAVVLTRARLLNKSETFTATIDSGLTNTKLNATITFTSPVF